VPAEDIRVSGKHADDIAYDLSKEQRERFPLYDEKRLTKDWKKAA